MITTISDTQQIIWQNQHETLQIEAWGADSVRVRANLRRIREDVPHALLAPAKTAVLIEQNEAETRLINGRLTTILSKNGRLRFIHTDTGAELLAEQHGRPSWPPARLLRHEGGDLVSIAAHFAAYDDEKLYGLGQHQHGRLDQKGCVIHLRQFNTEVNIPFMLSNRGYGFLWNNPAIGKAELAYNGTTWTSDAAFQMDYWITAGDTPAEILHHYADATGHAPLLPEWAAGFWQCKLQYRTQEELLTVAREYKARGLPLDVIVIDGLHTPMMGAWCFREEQWPDPSAMVAELKEMGVEVMVSVWPALATDSPHLPAMKARGFVIDSQRGYAAHLGLMDDRPIGFHLYDATNPEARTYLWSQLRESYYAHGIRGFWLDADEPEIAPADIDNLRYAAGPGTAVSNLYPVAHAQTIYDGLQQAGETDILTLNRSAWAGSQRWGAAVWSGDVASTFPVLAEQVRAGLNIGLSGIPWWTTDIGGFANGDPDDPTFQELIVRWFQYGVFCPLFRLHGFRAMKGDWWDGDLATMTGGPNEVWSFGDTAYDIIKGLLFLRERLKPYIMRHMQLAAETGLPPMRPLLVDFPDDADSWTVEDQFMFGADILVAPILAEGQTVRRVYLPSGENWVDVWQTTTHAGGQWLEVTAPLTQIPCFVREGAEVLAVFNIL